MSQDRNVPDPIVRVVEGVKIIKCPYPGCNKTVKKMWNYYSHARTHTDQRPYECKICKKTYRWQSSLKSHLRSHERREGQSSTPSNTPPPLPPPPLHNYPAQTPPQLPPIRTLLAPDYGGARGTYQIPPPYHGRYHGHHGSQASSRTPPSPIHPPHGRSTPSHGTQGASSRDGHPFSSGLFNSSRIQRKHSK